MTKLGSQFVSDDPHSRGTQGDTGATGATGGTGATGPAGPDINTTKGDVAGFDTASARIPIGTNGQVLTADSAEALGLKWAAAAAGDPLTTKGDLFGFNTDAARIPVGTNGQHLEADSTEALGLKWATPAAGGLGNAWNELPVDTNFAMMGIIAQGESQRTDATFSGGLVYCDFIFFDGLTTINQIAVNNATASGGGTVTVGLHPITSRLSVGDQDFVGTITVSTAANTKHTGVVSWTPTKGWYLLASWTATSITNLTLVSASTNSGGAMFFPAFAYSTVGDTEVERKTQAIRKTNYGTTPDLSAIDFNDISIYDSASQEEFAGLSSLLVVELRVA